jgi:integrase
MGVSKGEIDTLLLRRKTFLDVVGDRPIDQYCKSDLQDYVIRMQYWPVDANKRADDGNWDTKDILEANRDRSQRPMCITTMKDGYFANIKTMMRSEMTEWNYRDPFADARIKWPKGYAPSMPREGLDGGVLNRAFELGCASGQMDEAMLPLVALLTGRRMGLLLYLRGSDIREKHGVIIAQTAGIVLANGIWKRVPIKTGESATYFVLHNFLVEIGFVDWARAQGDKWLFAAAHEHPDPSKYTSKVMARLLQRAGARGGNIETFHSLRGDAISGMRSKTVQARAARLQVGHELGSEHDMYGFKALNAAEARKLANLKLSRELVLESFRNLDFDRLAAARRQRGRNSKV